MAHDARPDQDEAEQETVLGVHREAAHRAFDLQLDPAEPVLQAGPTSQKKPRGPTALQRDGPLRELSRQCCRR